jgi:DNA polymerase III sliding clamp (beta) subunit (PCNA family)
MLNILKLVKGSISKKDFIPILSHFHIYNGRIQGSNGRITIDAPIPQLKDLNVTVPSDKFIKAINSCKEEPKIKVSEKGNMSIVSGKFRARIPLAEHDKYPKVELPADNYIPINNQQILPILKRLKPFVGSDASRKWINSIYIHNGFAYATNNPVMARVPVEYDINGILPIFGIDELIRINKEPIRVHITENAIYFDLDDDVWIKIQTINSPWPDVESLFKSVDFSNLIIIPENLKEAIETIVPFCVDVKFPEIQFGKNWVTTADGDSRAMVEDIPLNSNSNWHALNFLLVLSEALGYDLTPYPKPCPWKGKGGIEGVMIGLKK